MYFGVCRNDYVCIIKIFMVYFNYSVGIIIFILIFLYVFIVRIFFVVVWLLSFDELCKVYGNFIKGDSFCFCWKSSKS